jgi:hypothetical protein
VLNLMAILIGGAVGYLPHLFFGQQLGFLADFLLCSVVGGAAYVFSFYKLKQLRGDV